MTDDLVHQSVEPNFPETTHFRSPQQLAYQKRVI
jgi:hypothetical protein